MKIIKVYNHTVRRSMAQINRFAIGWRCTGGFWSVNEIDRCSHRRIVAIRLWESENHGKQKLQFKKLVNTQIKYSIREIP